MKTRSSSSSSSMWGGSSSGSTTVLLLAAAVALALLWAGRGAFTSAASRFRGFEPLGRPRARLNGRFWPGPDGSDGTATLPQLMTWSASSATFAFTGASSVSVVINGSLEALPEQDRKHAKLMPGFPQSYFQFELDGQPVGRESTRPIAPVLTWRLDGLSLGQHTLTVTKLSEARNGAALLQAVTLQPSAHAAFLPPPRSPGQRTGRRILFLGDSYTVGMGNAGWPQCLMPNVPNVTNSLLAYGPLVARHYGADFQLVAWSGAGLNVWTKMLVQRWPERLRRVASPRMQELLHMADPLDPSSSYDASSWVPQIVVMAGGTNDFHNYTLSIDSHDHQVQPSPIAPPSLTDWLEGYKALIQEIRRLYPAAAIVSMVWPLEVQLVGVKTLPQTAVYLQYMAAAFSRLQRARIPNTHFLQLTGHAMNGSNFCTAHPDAAAHADVARQLIDFIDAAGLLGGA